MIYDIDGSSLNSVFDGNGDTLNSAFNIDGEQVYSTGRTILFEDNFSGSALDSSKWGYELGYVRNNELQAYRGENNVSVEDGCLVITAKKEDYGTKHWTSGSITGQGKFTFTYGRAEARIKFPNIQGAFPAFWTLGANHIVEYHETGTPTSSGVTWSECGEIDIVEITKGNRNKAKATLWGINDSMLGSQILSDTINVTDWNIYACEWTAEYIAMFVNNVEFARWTFSDYGDTQTQAYHLPQYLLLDLAVGGYNQDDPPASSTTEMKMYVDWVRVYAPLTA